MNPGIVKSKSGCGVAFMAAALCIPTALACGGSPAQSTPQGAAIRNENNYSAQSTLNIPTVTTKAAVDLDVCWGNIAKDMQCHACSPTSDIDNVSFLQIIGLTKQQIKDELSAGRSPTKYIKTYRDFHVDHSSSSTCTKLSALTFGGTALVPAQDYVAADDKHYMLLFAKGTQMAIGARTMTFIEPSADSDVTSAEAPDGCNILSFTPDLSSLRALDVPAAGPWTVDWSQITTDGMGNDVIFENIDSVMLAFYQGKTLDYLQEHFFDLEIIPTLMYQAPIEMGVTSFDLATAKTTDNQPFAGFSSTDGVWALALRCSSCSVPAPVVFTILNPTTAN